MPRSNRKGREKEIEEISQSLHFTSSFHAAGRTNNRSAWAAQVAKDAGLQRCLVHRQGVYGWQYDPAVLPYRRYAVLDPPPEPEPFTVEEVDAEAGRVQLLQLGLI